MEQIDFSNSFYMEEAVIRSMLHVSHTTREEGPIIFFQIITEKERGSHNSDSLTRIAMIMSSMQVIVMMRRRKKNAMIKKMMIVTIFAQASRLRRWSQIF